MRRMERDEEGDVLYLAATGRRSGLARQIEIWFTGRNGRYYVIAEHGERAQWVQNVLANPRVRVRIAEAAFAAQARVVEAQSEPVLTAAVQACFREKYGWDDGLIVELEPLG
jgi:deazaflavin-dependent oxidoreductase (nitroreductase family)